jgi:peptidoglycan/LPS O-acetylase OafA/YrhL
MVTIDKPKPRIFFEVIETMRGVAALGVVFYHFANGTLPSLTPNFFGSFLEWARMGIPIFFVISGFVIPYSMYVSGYRLRDAGRYFLKRMIRMAPPAWISILIVFGIYYGAIWLKGKPIEGMTWPGTSWEAILANLGFSFILFDVEKYIEVYWTLEVEFQFYVLIPFLLPVLLKYHRNQFVLSMILIGINSTYFFHNDRILFFQFNTYFIMGILLFLYRMNLIERNYFVFASSLAAAACYAQVGATAACASVIGVLFIGLVRYHNSVTDFLGMISFSLYITHRSVGVVSEFVLKNLYGPDPSEPVKLVMFVVYLAIAIAFAWVFYKLVEEPFLRLSKRVRIRPRLQ